MLQLKKLTLAVLAISSTYSFAGTMGDKCMSGGNVTVPCEKTGWDVGAQALYFQPVYDAMGNYPAVLREGPASINNTPTYSVYPESHPRATS